MVVYEISYWIYTWGLVGGCCVWKMKLMLTLTSFADGDFWKDITPTKLHLGRWVIAVDPFVHIYRNDCTLICYKYLQVMFSNPRQKFMAMAGTAELMVPLPAIPILYSSMFIIVIIIRYVSIMDCILYIV